MVEVAVKMKAVAEKRLKQENWRLCLELPLKSRCRCRKRTEKYRAVKVALNVFKEEVKSVGSYCAEQVYGRIVEVKERLKSHSNEYQFD